MVGFENTKRSRCVGNDLPAQADEDALRHWLQRRRPGIGLHVLSDKVDHVALSVRRHHQASIRRTSFRRPSPKWCFSTAPTWARMTA